MSNDGPDWFAPKRYGYGSGWPIRREGWAVTIAYLVLLALASLLLPYGWMAYISVVAAITIAFVVIVARTTRGGFRWRWGEDD